jgi:hypothetical protein
MEREGRLMNNSIILDFENHLSRERIRNMGEVFTPEQCVHQMLNLFDDKIWADENVIFFEPSVGRGNIVLVILEKRITALRKKYHEAKREKPVLHAVANAVHTLWAIDICPVNIELTRKRIFDHVVAILQGSDDKMNQSKTRGFLAHVLCTLTWQIHGNEALSCLGDKAEVYTQASKTKLGRDWIDKNKYKLIDFALDWCEFYKQTLRQNTVPLAYERALRLIESSAKSNRVRGFDEFAFAKDALQRLSDTRTALTLDIGVA